jgi:hypothetical protein
MREAISGIIKDAFAKGKKGFDQQFGLEKYTATGRETRESQNNIDRILNRILSYINDNIEQVDWENPAAVEAFCATIDTLVANQAGRFTIAYKKIGSKTSPSVIWKEFVVWEGKLRQQTKQQILSEVAEFKKREQKNRTDKAQAGDSGSDQDGEKEDGEGTREEDKNDTADNQGDQDEKREPKKEKKRPKSVIALTGDLAVLTDALEGGDIAGAKELLPDITKAAARIETELNDAETIWETDAQAYEARINRLEQEIIGLQERQIANSDELEEKNNQAAELQRETEAKQRLISELRLQIAELHAKIEETQFRLVEAQTTSREIPIPVEQSKEIYTGEILAETLGQKRLLLAQRETELNDHIDQIDNQVFEIMDWIQDTTAEMTALMSRLKAQADDKELPEIRKKQERIDVLIAKKEKGKVRLDALARELETEKDNIVKEIESLRQAEEAARNGLEPVNFVALPKISEVSLPSIDDLLKQAEPAETPVTPSHPIIPAETTIEGDKEKIVRVEGLPYTVVFSEEERSGIYRLEEFLLRFKNKPVDEIIHQLPEKPEDETKLMYYNGLIQGLQSGEFLPNLKLAITVLGAMRRDGAFVQQMSRDVANAFILKGVRIFNGLGAQSSQAVRTLLQVSMLAEQHEELNLCTRGLKLRWGSLNQLTPLGERASQVWTKDLLDNNVVTREQLSRIYEFEQIKQRKLVEKRKKT